MNRTKRIIGILSAVIIACGSVFAQGPMTPYSRYGYGILNDNATSAQRAMGGVGYAMSSGRQINVMNPASYAAMDSLTFLFDMGITGTALWSTEGEESGKDFGGGLDYVTIQFPICKNVGVSAGLLPYTSVGYAFGSKIDNGSSSRSGNGGLNQLYVGVGASPLKGLSVGANISYLFGTNINDTYVVTSAGSTTLFERVVQVRDYHLQFGIQYAYNLNRDNKLTAGLTYSPKKTLLGHAWGVNYDVTSDTEPDTIGYMSMRNNFSLPDTWGFGVNYQWRDRLILEADFTYQNWKDAKYTLVEDPDRMQEFNNRWKFALGGQFTPRPRGNYVQRINYRLGGYYSNDYLKIGDNSLREYGLSMGFGLPAPGSKTVINLGFEWKHRQANPNPLIKENYFNITLGINFNELWFYQPKIR